MFFNPDETTPEPSCQCEEELKIGENHPENRCSNNPDKCRVCCECCDFPEDYEPGDEDRRFYAIRIGVENPAILEVYETYIVENFVSYKIIKESVVNNLLTCSKGVFYVEEDAEELEFILLLTEISK